MPRVQNIPNREIAIVTLFMCFVFWLKRSMEDLAGTCKPSGYGLSTPEIKRRKTIDSEPESVEKASPLNPYRVTPEPKPLAEVVVLEDAAEPTKDAEQGAMEEAEPAAEPTGGTRTYAWVAEELSSAKTELTKMKLLEKFDKCAQLKDEVDRLTAELALLPKPRTQEVVMMELEKKEAEITALKSAEKSRGWNACLRTITTPVT